MRWLQAVLLGAVGLALAGCFVADDWLIAPGDAAFPYQTMTITAGNGGEIVLTREGDTYVAEGEDEKILLRFEHVRDNYYVAQMAGEDPAEGMLLGLLDVDFAAGTARAFKVFATDQDTASGLRICDQAMCVDDLAAYTDFAIAAAERGEEPQETYQIVSKN